MARAALARIRALCEGDVLHRARLLAESGADRLFNDLAPILRWRDGVLLVAHRRVDADRDLSGRGLVLVPSVFAWPEVYTKVDPQWQPVLRYPPKGIAALWETGGPRVPGRWSPSWAGGERSCSLNWTPRPPPLNSPPVPA